MQYLPSGFRCPHCDREIRVCVGIPERRWLQLLNLQARRNGTDLRCHHCGKWSHHLAGRAEQDQSPNETPNVND